MSQYQQDELARLFAHNLSLSQPQPQHSSTPDKQFLDHDQTTYYISQHYTPSSYYPIQEATEQPTQRADSPLSAPVPEDSLASVLRQHDIDPSSLSPSQVKLFTNADYEQRLRLLELWRISPPQPSDMWQQQTNMTQEEELARLRYEERMNGQGHQHSSAKDEGMQGEAEPYMSSGYSRHSEPVYAACSGGLWQSSVSEHDIAVQQMEDRYGAFQQARNFEQLQTLNAQVENQRIGAASADDDDMIM